MPLTALAHAANFLTSPATDNCADIHGRRKHVLLGVSPFNSGFSDAYVARLVWWAHTTFESFDILLAGEKAAALQLEAMGTPEGKARYKARRALRRNRRAAEAALGRLGDAAQGAHVLQVSDFERNPVYERVRAVATTAFDSDPAFRSACLDMAAKAVLDRLRTVHGSSAPITTEQAEHAATYILAELPFFLQTPSLLDVEESLLAYHQPWELGEQIFARAFSLTASSAALLGPVLARPLSTG